MLDDLHCCRRLDNEEVGVVAEECESTCSVMVGCCVQDATCCETALRYFDEHEVVVVLNVVVDNEFSVECVTSYIGFEVLIGFRCDEADSSYHRYP